MKFVPFLLACLLFAQTDAPVAEKANAHYQTPEARQGMMKTLTDPSRDARQRPQDLVAALGIKPGMTVVDLGSGPGYMLPHLSKAVGPEGKVIAQDVFADFLKASEERNSQLKNVTYILGSAKETKLGEKVADLILVLDVYHHLDFPSRTLAELKRALKPGGRLAIVEYHKNDVAMNGNAKEHVRLAESDAIAEIESNGFRLVSKSEFSPKIQWLGFFQAKTP